MGSSQIPAIQSIWIYGKDGRALVSSWLHPPPERIFSERVFFVARVCGDVGTYYGQAYQSVYGAQPFLTVSRRLDRNGEFVGIIAASVLPSNSFRSFATWADGAGQQYALMRNDGLILARYPVVPPGAADRLGDFAP